MNYLHRRLCRSARWKQTVEKYALPWTLEDVHLGDDVLEVGPFVFFRKAVLNLNIWHGDLKRTQKATPTYV